ncbi:MAG: hypothetical protein HQK53_14830 [Oligoflexia bacterium]|nr:hypothetical protein [Oligoflexia bacterium]
MEFQLIRKNIPDNTLTLYGLYAIPSSTLTKESDPEYTHATNNTPGRSYLLGCSYRHKFNEYWGEIGFSKSFNVNMVT